MKLEGSIRRWARRAAGDVLARFTNWESLAVAQSEPRNMEATRCGSRYLLGYSAAPTGIAPVQALPTTQPQWCVFNPSTDRSIFVEEIGMFLTSGTPGVGGILLGCLFTLPAPTAQSVAGVDIALAGRAKDSGGSGSVAVVRSSPSVITSPAAPVWFHLATNPSPNVTAFAGSVSLEHRNLDGALCIRPGHALGLAVVAPAGTTPLFAPFGRWIETDIDLE